MFDLLFVLSAKEAMDFTGISWYVNSKHQNECQIHGSELNCFSKTADYNKKVKQTEVTRI